MQHIMIDLETLSTRPDAAILSIGAVFFDIETSSTPKNTASTTWA
jgi:DNA polymerase III epsilon subunit-like protein